MSAQAGMQHKLIVVVIDRAVAITSATGRVVGHGRHAVVGARACWFNVIVDVSRHARPVFDLSTLPKVSCVHHTRVVR